MSNNIENIENQELTEPLIFQGLLSDAKISSLEPIYPLRALEFEHINNGKPVIFIWAHGVLLTTVGFALSLGGKLLSKLFGINQEIVFAEKTTLALGFIITILLYIIGKCATNNKTTVLNNIEKFFKNSPTQQQIVHKGSKK
jgi:hypothetical protein